jgi:hypothetical protein
MKCFVASAFGRADVDEVYDRCIKPVLKTLSVQALRVDRVEHNEDIDNKIFELMGEADLAIVDLTYARPSVYYEAGYVQGNGKPVVYIARNDHFRARDNDPDGLFRVHFDLQMKNIISWFEANDEFSKRLDKRLRYVLKPLFRARDKEQKRQGERAQFSRLPLLSQIKLLEAKAESLLKQEAFSHKKQTSDMWSDYRWSLLSRGSNGYGQDVCLLVTISAVKSVFKGINSRTHYGLGPSKGLPERLHYVIVSLKSVPRSRVIDMLPSFCLLDDGALHLKPESKIGDKSADVFVHMIDGVKSESEFADAFLSIIARYGSKKGT